MDEQETEEAVKSKSQIKREFHALQEFGRDLTRLPDALLKKLGLDEDLLEEVRLCRTLKHGAHKRQIKHLGALLHEQDVDAMHARLDELQKPQREAVEGFHEVEHWRDQLVSGDDAVFGALAKRFPELDRQHLRQLVRNARSEQSAGKSPRASRTLFRYLSELVGE